ncbi:5500_t:CDS:2, partial [Acaulospora colombiana]
PQSTNTPPSPSSNTASANHTESENTFFYVREPFIRSSEWHRKTGIANGEMIERALEQTDRLMCPILWSYESAAVLSLELIQKGTGNHKLLLMMNMGRLKTGHHLGLGIVRIMRYSNGTNKQRFPECLE